MIIGVRGKLFVVLLTLVLGVGVAVGAYVEIGLRRRIEARVEAELLRHAQTARELVVLGPTLDPTYARRTDALADRLGHATGARVTIIAGNGTVLGDSLLSADEITHAENHGDRPEVRRAAKAKLGVSRRHSATVGAEMLYVAVPFSRNGQSGVVRVAMSLADVDAAVGSLRLTLLVAGVLGLGLAVMMTALASHLLSRTLRALVDHTVAVARGEGQRRVPIPSSDELGFLAGSFNRLAGQLDRTVTALARERDRFQTILESMSEAVLALDASRQITLANRAATDLLALPSPLDGDTRLTALKTPPLEELVAGCSQSSRPSTVEFELPGGALPRFVLARAEPLRASGGSVVVIHDVTEMRRLETVRRDFVANVSHELRTPVTVIRANTETLLDGALDDPDRARAFLGAVHRNAERLTSIIADLLDLSRIEAQQFDLHPTTTTLGAVVQRAAEAVEKAAREKRLTLEVSVDDAIGIHVDEKVLDQVLLNLLDNAVKYTQEGGRVVARSRSAKGAVCVEVCDDGPGIELKHRDRIFERFYRVDPGRSREMGGTGLGLSIVKHLVNAMGGDVGFEPATPRGSIFWFTVPKAG